MKIIKSILKMIGCDQKAVAAELVKKDPKTEEELKRIIEANQR